MVSELFLFHAHIVIYLNIKRQSTFVTYQQNNAFPVLMLLHLPVPTADTIAYLLLLKTLSCTIPSRFYSFFPGFPFLVAAGYSSSSSFKYGCPFNYGVCKQQLLKRVCLQRLCSTRRDAPAAVRSRRTTKSSPCSQQLEKPAHHKEEPVRCNEDHVCQN